MSIVRHVSANTLMLAVAFIAGIYLQPFSLHRVVYVTREQFDVPPDEHGLAACGATPVSFRLPIAELTVPSQIHLRNRIQGYSSVSLSDATVACRTVDYVRNCLRPAPCDYQSSSLFPPASTQSCDQLMLNGTQYWSLCSDYARLTNACLQAVGLDSRILWLEGHVVVEYYDREYRKWVLLDPHLNRMAYGADGVPLSIAQLISGMEQDVGTNWATICGPAAHPWQNDVPAVEATWFRNVLLNGECHVLTGETLSAHGRWDQLVKFHSRPTVIALSSPYDSSRCAFDAPLSSRCVVLLYGILMVAFYSGQFQLQSIAEPAICRLQRWRSRFRNERQV